MIMAQADFDNIVSDLRDQANDFSFEPRIDYSGRGMYGKTCVGFTTDNPIKFAMTLATILALSERDADDSGATYEGIYWYDLNPRTDNMGFDTIVYFTNWSVE